MEGRHSADVGTDGDLDRKKAAKITEMEKKLRRKRSRAERRAQRRERFNQAVIPMAVCVSRVDVDGLQKTETDVVEKCVRCVQI